MNNEDNFKKKINVLLAAAVSLLFVIVALMIYIFNLPAISSEKSEDTDIVTIEESEEVIECSHPSHDPTELWCSVCNEKVPHDYSSGTCPLCGRKAETTDYCLDYSLWLDLNDSGTVETVEYETKDYGNGTYRTETKKMQVYLPYGYSEENKYNVLILLHGSDGTENYWFSRDQYYTYPDDDMCYSVRINILLDNMIYYRYCEPLIVVSPTYYLNDYERDQGDLPYRDAEQFAEELRNDILPYLAEHYSTYAADGSYDSLKAAREHFALIGASYGAFVTYRSVISRNIDLISWIGAVSGCNTPIKDYVVPAIDAAEFDGCDIDLLYIAAGSNDSLREDAYEGYEDMLAYCSKINSDNIMFVEMKNAVHEDRVWDNAIYNCLFYFFKNT